MFGGVYGWVFGGVLGWVFREHPPFNFSSFIVVLNDMGGCWGVFAQNYIFLLFIVNSKLFVFLPTQSAIAVKMHVETCGAAGRGTT